MLDADLARIYGVSTKRLNQQFLRNRLRFPEDFAFQLSEKEVSSLRLQYATSKAGRGGRRYRPYVFTEHGAVMLASVLHTQVAIQASIMIARAFVRLRRMVSGNRAMVQMLRKLDKRVSAHDVQMRDILDAIRGLMDLPEPPSRRIGFRLD